MAKSNKGLITAVVAAVEISMGIAEGIIMPNIFERPKGAKFFLPAKGKVISIGGTLLVTGILSGVLSEWYLTKYKVPENRRVITIAAICILVNLLEVIMVPNVAGDKGFFKTGKVAIPTMREFVPMFGFLVLTSAIGSYAEDRILTALAEPKEPVVVPAEPSIAAL